MIGEILMAMTLFMAVIAAALELMFCDSGHTGYPDVWSDPVVETVHDIAVIIAILSILGAALCGICGVG